VTEAVLLAAPARPRPTSVPPVVHDVLRSPGEPLDGALRRDLEPRFGHDFSRVRVHRDAEAARSARAVGALAYAVGPDVVFGEGRYAPRTPAGRQLLAHELAHVVQHRHPGGGPLRLGDVDGAPERAAEIAAAQALAGRVPSIAAAAAAVQRAADPYITNVAVNLSPKESAALTWSGTPPTSPGKDSFTVSTGKGYSDPTDDPGTCLRTCCSDPDTQCAPPWDEPKKVGACCTPVGTFHTGKPRDDKPWPWWTPVEPLHTTYNRGIALHHHSTVTGDAIGHGCIRMEEGNAQRIYQYSRGAETKVTISGKAKVECPADRRCGAKTGMLEGGAEAGTAVAALDRPDEESTT